MKSKKNYLKGFVLIRFTDSKEKPFHVESIEKFSKNPPLNRKYITIGTFHSESLCFDIIENYLECEKEEERELNMSLSICDDGHEEICYNHTMDNVCPVCKLQKEIEDLEDRIQELENQ